MYQFCVLTGLVGDILLNNIPLQDFTIYSLDMKPSFIDRFVCFIEPTVLYVDRFHLSVIVFFEVPLSVSIRHLGKLSLMLPAFQVFS